MTNDQIKHMVDRFLGWRLPEHFRPDAGISFNPEYNVEFNARYGKPPALHQPIGTNLFGREQAEAMVRYMLEGMPSQDYEWMVLDRDSHQRVALRAMERADKVTAYAKEWCKPDEHSPPEHWAAYRECFQSDRRADAS